MFSEGELDEVDGMNARRRMRLTERMGTETRARFDLRSRVQFKHLP